MVVSNSIRFDTLTILTEWPTLSVCPHAVLGENGQQRESIVSYVFIAAHVSPVFALGGKLGSPR